MGKNAEFRVLISSYGAQVVDAEFVVGHIKQLVVNFASEVTELVLLIEMLLLKTSSKTFFLECGHHSSKLWGMKVVSTKMFLSWSWTD